MRDFFKGQKMRDFFTGKKFKVIAAVCLVLLGSMIYSLSRGGKASYLESLFGALTVPFQKANTAVVNSVSDFFVKIGDCDRLKEENSMLRNEIRKLQTLKIQNEMLSQENGYLKDSLGLKDRLSELSLTKSKVIGRDPSGWFDVISIDCGSIAGVSFRDPVISNGCLIGFVSEVYLSYSKVTTILDPSFECGALEMRTGEVAVAEGNYVLRESGKCKMCYLPRKTKIVAGDMVLTSGLGGSFPKNIIIGTVEKVVVESHGASSYAVIKPYTDIGELRNVYVVTDFTGQESD